MKPIYDWFNEKVSGFTMEHYGFMDKVLFWLAVLFAIIFLGLIIYCIYSLFDLITSHTETSNGIIIDKSHEPSTLSTNVGYGVVGGQGALLVTQSGHAESWEIIVREDDSNQVLKFETTMQYMYDCKVGQKQQFEVRIGGLSKTIIGKKLI